MIISPDYPVFTRLAKGLFTLSSQQYYLTITLVSFHLWIIYYPPATSLLIMKQLFTYPSMSPFPLITTT